MDLNKAWALINNTGPILAYKLKLAYKQKVLLYRKQCREYGDSKYHLFTFSKRKKKKLPIKIRFSKELTMLISSTKHFNSIQRADSEKWNSSSLHCRLIRLLRAKGILIICDSVL